MHKNNIFNDGSALLVALTLTVIGMLCVLGVEKHMQNSLVEAVNALELCRADGMSECHIERDGLYFNVYCEEEE